MQDLSITSGIPTTPTDLTLSTPLGIKTKPKINFALTHSSAQVASIVDKNSGVVFRVAMHNSSTATRSINTFSEIYTNASSQIQHYYTTTTANEYSFETIGFVDDRLE